MPGKGKRRRLRNQQIAREQATRTQNMQNHRTFALHDGPNPLLSGKEDAHVPRNLRFIMDFTAKRERGAGGAEASTSAGASTSAKPGAEKVAVRSEDPASAPASKRAKKGNGKAKAEPEFQLSKDKAARDGKVKLERTKAQGKKKKGYLQLRKEKKLEKKQRKKQAMQDDEDADLKYDERKFFDEVAYEPPQLAMQKSKEFYSAKKAGRKQK